MTINMESTLWALARAAQQAALVFFEAGGFNHRRRAGITAHLLLGESSIRVELNAFEFLETIIDPTVTHFVGLVFFEAGGFNHRRRVGFSAPAACDFNWRVILRCSMNEF